MIGQVHETRVGAWDSPFSGLSLYLNTTVAIAAESLSRASTLTLDVEKLRLSTPTKKTETAGLT